MTAIQRGDDNAVVVRVSRYTAGQPMFSDLEACAAASHLAKMYKADDIIVEVDGERAKKYDARKVHKLVAQLPALARLRGFGNVEDPRLGTNAALGWHYPGQSWMTSKKTGLLIRAFDPNLREYVKR